MHVIQASTGTWTWTSAGTIWTISNGTCTAATDDVVLTNNDNPTAVITNNTGLQQQASEQVGI